MKYQKKNATIFAFECFGGQRVCVQLLSNNF